MQTECLTKRANHRQLWQLLVKSLTMETRDGWLHMVLRAGPNLGNRTHVIPRFGTFTNGVRKRSQVQPALVRRLRSYYGPYQVRNYES
jgi:hypothetical protein